MQARSVQAWQQASTNRLQEADLDKIHHAALDVLEKVGMANSIPSCVEVLGAKGCKLGDDGRLRFPRALIEDTLTICARRFPLYARDPKHDLEPWGIEGTFRHGGCGGAHRRAKDRNLPGLAAGRPV
jgi:trimethylamine--corrinoid protein Co-methyltransferase